MFYFQGILIGLANLDGVVKVIRSAKDSAEASEELQKGYLLFDLILLHVLHNFHYEANQGLQRIKLISYILKCRVQCYACTS